MRGKLREVIGAEHAVIDEADIHRAGLQRIVTQAQPPMRHELIDTLHIPAALVAVVISRTNAARAARQCAILTAFEILALQFEVVHRAVAVRRPFPDAVGDPHPALAAEAVGYRIARAVNIIKAALFGRAAQPRQPHAPGVADARVAPQMREYRPLRDAVLVVVGAGESAPAAGFRAEFEEQVGWRKPPDLHAIVTQLVAEESLVRQRRIGKIPGVGMLLVHVADAREEAPPLEAEPIAQAEALEVGVFKIDTPFRRQRENRRAAPVGVDIGGQDKFRFAQAEAACAGADFAQRWHKAGDLVSVRILLQVVVRPLQDHRHLGVEAVALRGRGGLLKHGLLRC